MSKATEFCDVCGKVCYPSRAKANAAANDVQRRSPLGSVTAYQCTSGHWHFHRRAKQGRGAKLVTYKRK